GASVRDSVWDSVGASGYGRHDASWLAFYRFFHDIGLEDETDKLEGLWKIGRSARWWLPHARMCWISERHTIVRRDERGRVYSKNRKGDGPSLGVQVVKSMPGPDGGRRKYMLRVHPELRPLHRDGTFGEPQELTARNAAASTFGLRGVEYAPKSES